MTDAVEAGSATVKTVDNHIYFYCEVECHTTLALVEQLRELDKTLQWNRLRFNVPDDYPHIPIYLHVNSEGGSLFDGMNALDTIQSLSSPVYSIGEGIVASAATLLTIGCTRRFIRPNTLMLIHQLSNWHFGNYEQLKDGMRLNEMAMERVYTVYKTHSNLKKKTIRKLLKRDYWMGAGEIIEKGFADAIYE